MIGIGDNHTLRQNLEVAPCSGPSQPPARRSTADYDVEGLAASLRASIRGQVLGDAGSLALYATDASNYRGVPDLVVLHATLEELAVAVTLAARAGAPVVPRGAGTSMAGNAIGGVVVDASRSVNRILDLDPVSGPLGWSRGWCSPRSTPRRHHTVWSSSPIPPRRAERTSLA